MKKIALVATVAALFSASAVEARYARAYQGGYGDDYYTNVSGHQVHRPVAASARPAGASAKCYDGTYSFSEHRQGTCSHHGGVMTFF
jgi:hypothetical protein